VLVLEQRDVPGGKAASISTHGFRLDPGPSIIVLPEIYEAVFKAAGRKMSDYLQFIRLDPITRVFFEGQEAIDLPGDRQECERLVSSFGAKDGENFKAMFLNLY
jgi:phytoene desaturase